MDKITPPSSPMMHVPSKTEAAIFSAIPGIPDSPDDIADPVVPPGTIDEAPAPPPSAAPPIPPLPDALLPMAHGFCQYLQARMHAWLMDEHRQLMTAVDGSLISVREWAREVFQSNEHASYQLANALEKGLALTQTVAKAHPYTAVIEARSPNGFPLKFTIEKGTAEDLIDELGRLDGWLVANGYTVADGVRL